MTPKVVPKCLGQSGAKYRRWSPVFILDLALISNF